MLFSQELIFFIKINLISSISFWFSFQISSADLPPPPEDAEVELDKRKLWIGNLDSRITE